MALYTASESPAIIVREVDLTNGVPNVPTSTGVIVGDFRWGPVELPVLVNNEATLANTFGNPDPDRSVDFHSASYYLRYSDDLYVVRAIRDVTPGAAADVLVNLDINGQVGSITVSPNGGYVTAPSATISDPDSGTAPALTVTFDANTNSITAITAAAGSYLYNTTPTITITGDRGAAANAFDNGGSPTIYPVIKNEDNFENQKASLATNGHRIIAKWPGELGNSLTVSMCPANDSDYSSWAYKTYFDGAPGTSTYADRKGASNDEVHVIVIDTKGEFTGAQNTVLETFKFLSVASDAKKTDGGSNYVVEVVNRVSKYIWLASLPAALGTNRSTVATSGKNYYSGATGTYTASLVNGSNSFALSVANYRDGYDLLNDPNTYLVDFLIAPGISNATSHKEVINHMVSIAELIRKDCVVVASPNRSAVVDDPTEARVNILTDLSSGITRSSYLVMDANYLKVYDKYNDQYIYIPAASSTAGLMASTDNNFAPWFSPAGTRRGRYFGVTQLAYNPNKQDRDELYKAGFNPIANIPGEGILLYGDKTHLSRPSAFDRINVRRLFLVLERAIARAAQNILFEFNDEFTRAEFVNIVEPVLRNVQGRRGITDFKLVCDETNNTPEIIDTNQFIATLFIKPARSINYITLNFVAVRTGVSFEEVVGDNRI